MEYVPWEEGALELGLDEELGVEQVRGRVKGRARDGGVDVVRSGDGVTVRFKLASAGLPDCRKPGTGSRLTR